MRVMFGWWLHPFCSVHSSVLCTGTFSLQPDRDLVYDPCQPVIQAPRGCQQMMTATI